VEEAVRDKDSIEEASWRKAKRTAALVAKLAVNGKQGTTVAVIAGQRAVEVYAAHLKHREAGLRHVAKRVHREAMTHALEGVTERVARNAARTAETTTVKLVKALMSQKLGVKDRAVRATVLKRCTDVISTQAASVAAETAMSTVTKTTSDYVYDQACKQMTDSKAPTPVLYEAEQAALKSCKAAAEKVGYPAAEKASRKAVQKLAQKYAKNNATQWVMDGILLRAVLKGCVAAQKVTSKLTVTMVQKVLLDTVQLAAKDVLNNYTLPNAKYKRIALKAATDSTVLRLTPDALQVAFEGRRIGVRRAIHLQGLAAMKKALVQKTSIETAAWAAAEKGAVKAALKGASEQVTRLAQKKAYPLAGSAAKHACIKAVARSVVCKGLPSVLKKAETKLGVVCSHKMQTIANQQADEVIGRLKIPNDSSLRSTARGYAQGICKDHQSILKEAVAALIKAIRQNAKAAAMRVVITKLSSTGKERMDMIKTAKALISGEYVTEKYLYFGKVAVPLKEALDNVAAALILPKIGKAITGAALHVAIDTIAQKAAKTTLQKAVAGICTKEQSSLERAALTTVTEKMMKCGQFGAKEIQAAKATTKAAVKERLSELSQGGGVLSDSLKKEVFAAAKLAAKHTSNAMQAGAVKAAKEVAVKSFRQLVRLVSQTTMNAASSRKMAAMAEKLLHAQLVSKVTRVATTTAHSALKANCTTALQRALSKAAEKAGEQLKVSNVDLIKAAADTLTQNAWNLGGGEALVKTLSNQAENTAKTSSEGIVTRSATAACTAGKDMERAVLSTGLAEVEHVIDKKIGHSLVMAIKQKKGQFLSAAKSEITQLIKNHKPQE